MKIKILCLLGAFVALTSCSKKNLVYLSDLQEQDEYNEAIVNINEPRIKPDDILSITVASLSPEGNALFNVGEVSYAGSAGSGNTTNINKEGFLVDKDGYIDYPILGKVKLGGQTKEEAKAMLKEDLKKYLKEPIVRVRFLNYKITVIGEVSNPSTFTIPSEKINILEALGMAGDMTVFGKRENVLIIREEEGNRKMKRINLNNKDVLNSPYFYLQQNDVVYVEPNNAKSAQASLTRNNISLAMSVISLVMIIAFRFQ